MLGLVSLVPVFSVLRFALTIIHGSRRAVKNAALPHPCIIVNANRRTETKTGNEARVGYLGLGLRYEAGICTIEVSVNGAFN